MQKSLDGMFRVAPVSGFGRPAGARAEKPLPVPTVDAAMGVSGALRVQLAGGLLPQLALHSSLIPIDQLYRRLPEAGLFQATPTRPYTIVMGQYQVPDNQLLFLLDWRFDVYRPSGAIAGDTLPVSERSWSLQIGWDVLFSDKHPPTMGAFQIVPSVPPPGMLNEQFALGVPSPNDAFARMRALQNQIPGGAGASMLPQRHRRDVQPEMPFTYIVEQNTVVEFRMIAINAVTTPLAFFEAEFSGLIVPRSAFEAFVSSAAPSIQQSGVR